jgi:hypothetical protein
MRPRVKQILDLCERYDIIIVSFGLAPNPNGFCFEPSPRTPKGAKRALADMMQALNKGEEAELRCVIFG